MEILGIIFVHLLGASAIYIFFTLRFNRALERSRREVYSRELKENIELAVKFINSAIELVDKKSRSSYDMLRKAEELLTEIKREGGVKKRGRRSQNRPPLPQETQKTKRETEAEREVEKKTEGHKKNVAERALERLDRDRQDIVDIRPLAQNVETIYQSAAMSSSQIHPDPPVKEENELRNITGNTLINSMAQKLGAFLQAGSTKKNRAKKGEAPAPHLPPPQETYQQPFPSQNWRQKEPNEPPQDGLPLNQLWQEELPQDELSPNQLSQERLPQGGLSQNQLSQEELSQEGLSLDQLWQDRLPQDRISEENVPEENVPYRVGRRQLVQSLLKKGYDQKNIVAMTGIPPAEVELLIALPTIPNNRPRKKRLI